MTPNHALQRTPGFGVQLPSAALIRPAQSRAVLPAMKPGTARAFALRRRAHSRAPGPESLSLGSLGDFAHLRAIRRSSKQSARQRVTSETMNLLRHVIAIFCIIGSAPTLHAATGIVPVSFKDTCLPLLKGQKELLAVIAAFDIKDTGRSLTGGAALPPQKQEDIRFAPFVFLARPKGSAGDYNLLLVVHYGYALMPAISFNIEPSNKYGIVILPRDIALNDPLFKFAGEP